MTSVSLPLTPPVAYLFFVRPMKSAARIVLLIAVTMGLLTEAVLLAGIPESSPSPPGTRREILAILREHGILSRRPQVLYIKPLTSESWLVGLRWKDGTSWNYSVNTVTKDWGIICGD